MNDDLKRVEGPEIEQKRPIDDQPRHKGRFMKGHRPTAHRKKGSKNKMPRSVAEWMLAAAEKLGLEGKGGGQGFAEHIGRVKPEALFNGLTKLVPPAKAEDPLGAGGYGPVTFTFCSLSPGDRVSSDGKTVLTEEQAKAEWLVTHPTFPDADDVVQLEGGLGTRLLEAPQRKPEVPEVEPPRPIASEPPRSNWPVRRVLTEDEAADLARRRRRARHGPSSEWDMPWARD